MNDGEFEAIVFLLLGGTLLKATTNGFDLGRASFNHIKENTNGKVLVLVLL